MSKIVVKFTTLKYGDSEAKVYHRKSAFFEMTKKLKIGRGWPKSEGFWIVLGHHNRNIWHLPITKSCFFHRLKKKIADQKEGCCFWTARYFEYDRKVYRKEELPKSCFLNLFEQTYFWSWVKIYLLASKNAHVHELDPDEQ